MINQQEAIEFALKYLKDWTQYKKAKADANSYFHQIKKDAEEGNCEEAQAHLAEMKSAIKVDRPDLDWDQRRLALHGLMVAIVETVDQDDRIQEYSRLMLRELPGWGYLDVLGAINSFLEGIGSPWEVYQIERGVVDIRCAGLDEDSHPMAFFDNLFGTEFQENVFCLRQILMEARKLNNPK